MKRIPLAAGLLILAACSSQPESPGTAPGSTSGTAQGDGRDPGPRPESAGPPGGGAAPGPSPVRRADGRFTLAAEGLARPGDKGMAAGGGEAYRLQDGESDTEQYAHLEESPFLRVAQAPLSTFSIDVDTASWAVVRRFLNDGRLPPAGAVRIEELVNYFPYDYAPPAGDEPFAVHMEAAACPWTPEHRLVRIGLKGRVVDEGSRPAANLVFLVDVSGSMRSADKLPLLQQSLKLLAERLAERDRVAIVVYAGSSGLVLPSTPGDRRAEVLEALDRLEAGGSTNGGAGIRLAYATAAENFIPGGINRVILATDGDFNVGATSNDELVRLVQEKAKGGVFLSVLGFGRGNLKDDRLEAIADRGNGNYSYVDSLSEGRKVLVAQAGGTLHTIAKDVKIQVEFNPAKVAGYRLLGYENRLLLDRDFNDDTRDAGEIGAGHTVTALYEVVPAGVPVPAPEVDALKYQEVREAATAASGGELLTVRLRYKAPDGETSRLVEFALVDRGRDRAAATPEFRFAAAVACMGMVLRDSKFRGTASYDTVVELASGSLGEDEGGWRREFVDLVQKAQGLAAQPR